MRIDARNDNGPEVAGDDEFQILEGKAARRADEGIQLLVRHF
jgi:hypothetical protein